MTHPFSRWNLKLITLALSAGCAWPTLAASPTFQPPDVPVLGVNKFDLALQYLGLASGGDGSPRWQRLGRALARKALDDARYYNFAFLRISATGFAPSHPNDRNDLALWQSDPHRYWQVMDMLMDDVEKRHLQLVVTLNWQTMQFPLLAGETRADLIAKPNSRSFELAARYAREYIQRYRNRPGILFWELTNEMNLGADLDSKKRCETSDRAQTNGDEKTYCQASGNYSTDDMIGYMRRMANIVRNNDPTRPISSGFSIQRANAAALRRAPEWQPAQRHPDTEAEFIRQLQETHSPVDIVSAHIYGGHPQAQLGRFGDQGVDLIDRFQKASAAAGKQLFIGEFGDTSMNENDDGFNARVMNKLKEQRVSYAAPWILEYRHRLPSSAKKSEAASFTLDPENNMRTLTRMAKFNPPRRDNTVAPPRVVVVWPLECADTRAGDTVEITASADSAEQPRVEFWVNDKLVGQLDRPPYVWKVPTDEQGLYEVTAKVFDNRGQRNEYRTRWHPARSSSACEVLPVQ